jgi:hypothetical protein
MSLRRFPAAVRGRRDGVAGRVRSQQTAKLAGTGIVDSHTQTALLSTGDTPTLHVGSIGCAVTRLHSPPR